MFCIALQVQVQDLCNLQCTVPGGDEGPLCAFGSVPPFAAPLVMLPSLLQYRFHSSFPMQVLFLDSDCTPLLDPNALFDTPEFQQHGNLFFPGNCTIRELNVTTITMPLPLESNKARWEAKQTL
jgi:hypothetical protein